MAESFPNLRKEMDSQIQEVHNTPKKRNSKKSPMRQIKIKLSKVKPKMGILKAQENGNFSCTRKSREFLSKNFAGQKDDIFKVLKDKSCQPRIL